MASVFSRIGLLDVNVVVVRNAHTRRLFEKLCSRMK